MALSDWVTRCVTGDPEKVAALNDARQRLAEHEGETFPDDLNDAVIAAERDVPAVVRRRW